MRNLTYLLLLQIIACKHVNNTQKPSADSLAEIEKNKVLAAPSDLNSHKATKDTLYQLLDIAAKQDSLEFNNYVNFPTTFLYLKAGELFAVGTKSAVLIYNTGTDKYRCEIWSYVNPKDYKGPGKPQKAFWVAIDTCTITNLAPIQIALRFDDYNFDNKKDLYIVASISNGIGVEYGHLLLRNSKGGFSLNPECETLTNIVTNKAKKAIISNEYIDCGPNNQYPSGSICKVTNKWKNGKLFALKKECPCEDVNYP